MYVGLGRRTGVGQLGYQHDQIYLYPYPHPYVVTGEGLANTMLIHLNKPVERGRSEHINEGQDGYYCPCTSTLLELPQGGKGCTLNRHQRVCLSLCLPFYSQTVGFKRV